MRTRLGNAANANAQALASDAPPIRRRLANVVAPTAVSTAPPIQKRPASTGASGVRRIRRKGASTSESTPPRIQKRQASTGATIEPLIPEKTRESKHKDKYGPEHTQWYSRQFEAQRGRCAFCGRTEGEVATPKCPRLVTDHDHITGELRRLLCKDCNIAYGRFFEKSRAEGTYAGAVAQLNTLRNARHGLGGISHLRQVP